MILVSLDLETTGLNADKDQILEIGLVIEDTNAAELPPVEELPSLRLRLKYDVVRGNAFALALNVKLLEEMDSALSPQDAYEAMKEWLHLVVGNPKYTLLGKNVGTFDLQFLPPHIKRLFRHRVVDVGAVAMGVNPDLWTGNVVPSLGDLTGRPVAHTAVEDAQDVIRVLRELTCGYKGSP